MPDVPLFELEESLPPIPPAGDMTALRAYLAAMPPPRPKPAGMPKLNIGMPPRIDGLSEEARAATVTALLKIAHHLDVQEQSWLPPRMLAEWLCGVALDIQFDMYRHFRRHPLSRHERLALLAGSKAVADAG